MAVGRRVTVYRSPTGRVTVEFDVDSYKRGIARCAVGPELRGVVDAIAHTAELYAKSISPRSRRQHQHYQDSFRHQRTTVVLPPRWPMRRVCARLWNVAPHAAAVEWGGAHNPTGHRVLGKTLERLEHLAP